MKPWIQKLKDWSIWRRSRAVNVEMEEQRDLLRIIEQPERYLPEVVQAAHQELAFRREFMRDTEISIDLTDQVSPSRTRHSKRDQ